MSGLALQIFQATINLVPMDVIDILNNQYTIGSVSSSSVTFRSNSLQ